MEAVHAKPRRMGVKGYPGMRWLTGRFSSDSGERGRGRGDGGLRLKVRHESKGIGVAHRRVALHAGMGCKKIEGEDGTYGLNK